MKICDIIFSMPCYLVFCYIDPGTGFTLFGFGAWILVVLAGFLFITFSFLKNFFGKYRLILLIVTVALISATAIGAKLFMKKNLFSTKIIILGFDGLSPEILEPMMEKGVLPNFLKLKEIGSYRRLSTTNPSQSPVAWTGFSTGKNPGKNGIFDFIVRDPKTYNLDLVLSKFQNGKPIRPIKTKCFWQYTSEKRVPAVIISCPVTFPPDKMYGRMLSGMGVPDILGTEGTFTFYTSEKLDKKKDIGGKVFHVNQSSVMVMDLIGPKVAKIGTKVKNTTVPFKCTLSKDKKAVSLEYQNKKYGIRLGEWSNWCEVTFNLGFLRKAKGIFKFYLVELEPEFKLYISPINFDPRKALFKISYPANYSKELADNIGLYYTQGMPMDTWAVNEKRLDEKPFLAQVEEILREKKAMLNFELLRFQDGVLFCYFESPDIIQHMFWRYRDPGHPLYEKNALPIYRNIIPEWYKKMDKILGSVMQKTGKDDVIIVLSDHGFGSFRRAVHVNSWLRENGYLTLKDPEVKSGRELLRDVDWSKTKAYAISFGAVYINQKGREKYGIVNSGSDSEILKNAIKEKFAHWQDEKYKTSIINKVYTKEEIFTGDYQDSAPDLYIGFNDGYRASWQTALGATPDALIEDNLKKWSGSHLFDPSLIPGILFINKKITTDKPSIYDITPTVLKLTGYNEEEIEKCGFDGKPLF